VRVAGRGGNLVDNRAQIIIEKFMIHDKNMPLT